MSTDDVKLGGLTASFWSDAAVYSGANPMQGAGGFAGAFSSTGTGSWTALEKIGSNGQIQDLSSSFNFTFQLDSSKKSGTWSITNTTTKDVRIDLVFAMHASNSSGNFLFDDQLLSKGQTLSGTWNIQWLNNGGNIPGFSNLVLYGRDQRVLLAPVPEPHTWAMLAAGLLAVGFAARKRARR